MMLLCICSGRRPRFALRAAVPGFVAGFSALCSLCAGGGNYERSTFIRGRVIR